MYPNKPDFLKKPSLHCKKCRKQYLEPWDPKNSGNIYNVSKFTLKFYNICGTCLLQRSSILCNIAYEKSGNVVVIYMRTMQNLRSKFKKKKKPSLQKNKAVKLNINKRKLSGQVHLGEKMAFKVQSWETLKCNQSKQSVTSKLGHTFKKKRN